MKRAAISAAWAGAVLAAAAAAWAQPIQPLAVQSVEGELFFEGRYRRDDEVRGSRGVQNHERDLLLREGLDLLMQGYAYHPNLFDWTADLRFGLMQQDTTLLGEQRNSQGVLLGYDLSALVLKQKPVSFRAYARHNESFEDRSFARNIEIDHSTQGAQVFLKGDVFMSLLLEHRDFTESSDTREDQEDGYLVRYTLEDRRRRDSLTRLVYEHEDVDQSTLFLNTDGSTTFVPFPDTRDELTLTNSWVLDDTDGRDNRLDGQVRVLRRRGFFENDVLLIDQQLTLPHTDSFATFYRGVFSYDRTEVETDQRMRGEAGFHQRIYESLDIVGRVYVTDRQLTNGYEKSIGTLFDFDYRKLTPIGTLTATLSAGLEYNEEDFGDTFRLVNDESVTLVGIGASALDEPNVTPGSITVTDVSQAIVYTEGIDYLIEQLGPITQIRRLVGGAIAPGETVLVDYTAPAVGFAEYEQRLIDWRTRFDFDNVPLSVYTRVRWREQMLTGGNDPGNLDTEHVYLFGAELHPDPWRLVAEYERREHVIFPSWWAYRARLGYTDVIDAAVSVNLGLEYEMLQYINPEEFDIDPGEDFLETYGAFANITTKLRRDLLLRAEALYYDTRGRDDDLLARLGGGLVWERGQLSVELDGHFDIWEQQVDHGTSLVLELFVRREF